MKHRPEYHFLPPKNWMNDPNGPIIYHGITHLFYQYNPYDWHWGNIHWGHATSTDMLHWTHEPIALSPAHELGEEHCYSGCSYEKEGKLEFLYTSIGPGHCRENNAEQWVATTEDMVTWHPIDENPVIKTQDHPFDLTEWRDPFLFTYRGEKLLLLSGLVDGRYGAILLYRTTDMRHYEYLTMLYHDDASTLYECPNVIVFADQIVLLRSVMRKRNVRYMVGTMDRDYTFHVEHTGDVDYGEYFATNISYTEQGTPVLWGWCREAARGIFKEGGFLTDGAWAGVLAMPRIVGLDDNHQLTMSPLPALKELRKTTENKRFSNVVGTMAFETHSSTFELLCKVETVHPFSFYVLASDSLAEYTEIRFDPLAGTFTAILASSTVLPTDRASIPGRFVPTGGILEVQILVDHSLIEVFVNQSSCMTVRTFPIGEEGIIRLHSESPLKNCTVDIYTLAL